MNKLAQVMFFAVIFCGYSHAEIYELPDNGWYQLQLGESPWTVQCSTGDETACDVPPGEYRLLSFSKDGSVTAEFVKVEQANATSVSVKHEIIRCKVEYEVVTSRNARDDILSYVGGCSASCSTGQLVGVNCLATDRSPPTGLVYYIDTIYTMDENSAYCVVTEDPLDGSSFGTRRDDEPGVDYEVQLVCLR